MRLSTGVVTEPELISAANSVVNAPLLQLPHLISDRALKNATDALARQTAARFAMGYRPMIETITMPKKGHGPRPIGMLSPETKTLYHALVNALTPRLPSPSRGVEWSEHEEFGIDQPSDARLVDFDIAGCYEYIDHAILSEEIIIQTVDAKRVSSLMDLLKDLFPRRIGIPQAMEPSHALADAYLGQLERGINRAGYDVHRYADDFRIVAASFGEAQEAIERAVELARGVGLVLADGKTRILPPTNVKSELEHRKEAHERFKTEAKDALASIEHVRFEYDELRTVREVPDDLDIDFEALKRVVEAWVTRDGEESPESLHEARRINAHYGARALWGLRGAPERLENDWLVTIAEREPIRLIDVVKYVSSRCEEVEENWSVLSRLTKIPRQSPWARLWIAATADELEPASKEQEKDVLDWAHRLKDDRFEVVRAEAAWLLAGRGAISSDELARLYVVASDISRVGIAAATGRVIRTAGTSPDKVSTGICEESALTRAAFDWAMGDAD